MKRLPCLFSVAAIALFAGPLHCPVAAGADIAWENARVKAVLGEDAAWRSLVEKPSGGELCEADKRVRLADVVVEGKHHAASRATMDGERLVVGFAGCPTELLYEVSAADDWIAFKLAEVRGPRPSRVTLVRIGVTPTERVGPRMNVAWNNRSAVCLMGANRQTEARPAARAGYTELATASQDAPGPKLEGACAVLMVAPPGELRAVLRKVSVAFDMPRNEQDGVPAKELPLARQSYWFLPFGQNDADRVIELCRKTGFKQVLLNSGSWCLGPGHYRINTTAFPDGIEGLRRTAERFRAEGVLLGIHAFASKISKTDPYVTPVPDRRFWVDARATLARDVDAAAGEVPTRDDLSQWPGSPVCRQKLWEGGVDKHREVVIDDEIIQYESIGPEGRWDTLLGCRRGAWGTKAAAHQSGAECRRYGVDGCINGYIIDQETTLFDEVTSRLAGIFDACGLGLIYFDGSEDVDRRRFDYYAANAHAAVMAKIKTRPVVHTGGGFHHNLWHSFTRSGTVDTYLNTLHGHVLAGGTIDRWPTVRDHVDNSVRYVEGLEADMAPGELGWFGIWPKGPNTDGLQLDEIEYLMGKSLALDAPISLQTSFSQMERHPLTPGILEIVGAYERLRQSGRVPAETRARLRAQGRDFVLFRPGPAADDALPEFVEVAPVPEPAGTRDVRALAGPRGDGTVAVVWHYLGKEGKLVLDTDRVEARDLAGKPVPLEQSGGKTSVPLGPRRVALVFSGLKPEAVGKLLTAASLELRKPDLMWLRAEDYHAAAGRMRKGSEVGVADADPDWRPADAEARRALAGRGR